MEIFSSTIIPTIARPSLAHAVKSVLEQSLQDAFEVIVVNDSGKPLPVEDWQRDERVRVIHTNRRERVMARNSGAAVARGRYLHFLDDDDQLVPGGLKTLWDLAQKSDADWLYGGSQLVDRQGKPLLQLDHRLQGNCFIQVMAGEWIPLQSSLIKASAFFAVGGFTSLLFATQDVDLSRRILLHGDLDGTATVVAVIGMGLTNSSTDYDRGPALSRKAREKILDEVGVFSRLRASVKGPFWHGRFVRIYLTSVVWNMQHHRLFSALSRSAYTFAALALYWRSIFSPSFWQALLAAYQSETFLRGAQKAGIGDEQRKPFLDLVD